MARNSLINLEEMSEIDVERILRNCDLVELVARHWQNLDALAVLSLPAGSGGALFTGCRRKLGGIDCLRIEAASSLSPIPLIDNDGL